jgi:FHS family Na+ dependent glucose MFS transporter 1
MDTDYCFARGGSECILDVGGNTLIVWVHGEKVGPFMNGLHLFFAIGALMSPLLVAAAIQLTGNFGTAYWLLALLLLPVAIRFISLPNPTPLVSREDVVAVTPNLVLLLLIVAFFLLDAGAEQAFAGWIYTYAVKSSLANETTAALVNAAYWGAFTVGRVASIPVALRVRPRVIIIADMILALVGLGIMLVFSSSPLALWLGTIVFGLGTASAFPTMITFAGRHMTITGAITGWFFVGASAGGMILPALISQAFDPIGPTSVLLVIGGAIIGTLAVFVTVLGYVNREQRV